MDAARAPPISGGPTSKQVKQRARPTTVPPMRCSYDATRLSDNVRLIECWCSQKVHHSLQVSLRSASLQRAICVPSSPNNAPLQFVPSRSHTM